MVVGGFRGGLNITEVVSLNPTEHPVPTCLKRLQEYPFGHWGAVGDAIAGGT